MAAKAANPVVGAAVHTYEPDEYADMRLFLTEDRMAGFALHGDDIVSVFKHPDAPIKGFARAALAKAIAEGGRRLDCFDTVLPAFYSNNHFKAVSRIPFNDNYAPDGWDYKGMRPFNNGRPDVVFMVYDPEHKQLYTPGDGERCHDYDEAQVVQKRFVRQPMMAGDAAHKNDCGCDACTLDSIGPTMAYDGIAVWERFVDADIHVWQEEKHPRAQSGGPHGGEFISSGSPSGGFQTGTPVAAAASQFSPTTRKEAQDVGKMPKAHTTETLLKSLGLLLPSYANKIDRPFRIAIRAELMTRGVVPPPEPKAPKKGEKQAEPQPAPEGKPKQQEPEDNDKAQETALKVKAIEMSHNPQLYDLAEMQEIHKQLGEYGGDEVYNAWSALDDAIEDKQADEEKSKTKPDEDEVESLADKMAFNPDDYTEQEIAQVIGKLGGNVLEDSPEFNPTKAALNNALDKKQQKTKKTPPPPDLPQPHTESGPQKTAYEIASNPDTSGSYKVATLQKMYSNAYTGSTEKYIGQLLSNLGAAPKKQQATPTPAPNETIKPMKPVKSWQANMDRYNAAYNTTGHEDSTKLASYWASAKVQAWNGIPASNRDAVTTYTGGSYDAINNIMRGTSPPTQHWVDVINEIDDTFELPIAETKRDVVINRGTTLPEPIVAAMEKFLTAGLPARTPLDGFTSASYGQAAFSGKHYLSILVKKGTPSLMVKPVSNHEHENEVLLRTGQSYEVLEVVPHGGPQGAKLIRMVTV